VKASWVGAGIDDRRHDRQDRRMMLLHELRAERSGGDDFTFRPTCRLAFRAAFRPTLRAAFRAALGPAPPLHFGNQTRPHDDLFRDDPLQLT
jgi:hypothetical protein